MNKKLIFIIAAILLIVSFVLLYFIFTASNNTNKDSGYPKSVQNVLDNPIEKIDDNFKNLIKNDKYLISYGGGTSGGTFYITVNAEPVVDISKEAEQEFLKKLSIDEEYACSLTVILNVPNAIDSNLSEYDFGMSFCPDRIHITDVPIQPTKNTRYYDPELKPLTPQNSIR